MFFHRKGSVRPYKSHPPEGLLEYTNEEIQVNKSHPQYAMFCKKIESKQKFQNQILEIEFNTIFSYLYGLHKISETLQSFMDNQDKEKVPRTKALIYLAAAVSDFYLPLSEMSEHKIQSRDMTKAHGGLTLNLSSTPKYLYYITYIGLSSEISVKMLS